MDFEQRIQQFRKMAQEDPDNELGHFSLGKALLEAGRPGEAVESLSRVLTLNPKMSKSYQLLADACERAGDREKSIETLRRGIVVADEQGDRMPRDAMADMLRGFGATVPAFRDAGLSSPAVVDGGASTDGFSCSRCGRPSGRLAKVPFKGPLGEKIFDHVCAGCWREWIAMGTKVINELALVLSRPEGQRAYDQYMLEFLQIEER
ncbi:MAG: Fe(2+)-trafficking protein [Planctomycetota bacterium]